MKIQNWPFMKIIWCIWTNNFHFISWSLSYEINDKVSGVGRILKSDGDSSGLLSIRKGHHKRQYANDSGVLSLSIRTQKNNHHRLQSKYTYKCKYCEFLDEWSWVKLTGKLAECWKRLEVSSDQRQKNLWWTWKQKWQIMDQVHISWKSSFHVNVNNEFFLILQKTTITTTE